ncbi:MAG: hypothetical protein HRT38_20725 [Alteromonadaceae bacterium]|nr:hypothetical protein [Alteromonadaceae bacterium]
MEKGRYRVDRNMRLNEGNLLLSIGDQFSITDLLDDNNVRLLFHNKSTIVDQDVLAIGSSHLNLNLQLITSSS